MHQYPVLTLRRHICYTDPDGTGKPPDAATGYRLSSRSPCVSFTRPEPEPSKSRNHTPTRGRHSLGEAARPGPRRRCHAAPSGPWGRLTPRHATGRDHPAISRGQFNAHESTERSVDRVPAGRRDHGRLHHRFPQSGLHIRDRPYRRFQRRQRRRAAASSPGSSTPTLAGTGRAAPAGAENVRRRCRPRAGRRLHSCGDQAFPRLHPDHRRR